MERPRKKLSPLFLWIHQPQRSMRRRSAYDVAVLFIFCGAAVAFHFGGGKSNFRPTPVMSLDSRFQAEGDALVVPIDRRKTTALFSAALSSLSRSPVLKSIGSKVNLPNNRTIAETTWYLLNGTAIGSFNRSDFEVMEMIVESVLSQSHPRQSKRAALIVERFLHRIIQEQMAENPFADCVDMTALYSNLIEQWCICGEDGCAERAEEILDYFQSIYEEGDSFDPLLCGPSLQSFNAVMGAYARSGRSDAPQQVIRVLTKLYELNQEGRTTAAPNQESFAHVLRAWAKMASSDSPELVRKTLEHMDNLSASFPSVKPDFNCHNEYIYALAESLNYRRISGNEAAKRAEEYLFRMLESDDETILPDKWSFTMVLSILSRSHMPDLTERAEAVMARLEEYHAKSGRTEKTRPNANTYNSLMSCYTRHGNSEKAQKAIKLLYKMKKIGARWNPSAQPSTISYNIAMNSFVKSRRKDAPIRVEALLSELYETYNATGDPRIRPNLRSLNTCLDAWAKSGLDKADERILWWIQKARDDYKSGSIKIVPDIWSYTHYLQALSKSGRPRMGDEAERVLNEVEALYRGGYQSLKPNVLTFTSVIHCIALSGQSDAVERALSILDRMEDLHAEGFGDVRPNLFTYNCVINTIAKSKRRGKAEAAMQILRRIQSVALRPGCVSFNNVINACAFSNHPEDDPEAILQIALDVLKEAQDGPGANWITYQGTIRVICSFVADRERRWRLTREIFRQCCEDGQLTKTVMTQTRFAVTEAQFAQLEEEVTTDSKKKLLDKYTVNARRSFLEGTTTVVRV